MVHLVLRLDFRGIDVCREMEVVDVDVDVVVVVVVVDVSFEFEEIFPAESLAS